VTRTRALRELSLYVCCFLALGCSSGAAESAKPASSQCQDFETKYCEKIVDCAASTDRADDEDSCQFEFRVYLQCDQIHSATRDSQPCLDSIDAVQCYQIQSASLDSLINCGDLFQ